MNGFRLGQLALLLVTALGAVDLMIELPRMPEQVATRFDMNGQPAAFGSPAALGWGQAIAGASVLLIMGGLPVLLPRIPQSLLNVPHKDYWFAPERRDRSMRFVQAWMAWFGAWTQAFLLVIFHGIHRFHLVGGPEATFSGWVPMAVFFAGLGVGLFVLFARFGRPPGPRPKRRREDD